MDSDEAFHEDPGIVTGTDQSPIVDLGLNTDEANSASDANPMDALSNNNEARCINCGVDISHRRRHSLDLVEVLSLIRQWIAPQVVTEEAEICHCCWTLALNSPRTREELAANHPATGHRRRVCVSCGCSLLRTRSHRLHTNTEREALIFNIIRERILPQQLRGSDEICHPCWQRCDRLARRNLDPNEPPQNEASVITLPNFYRAADTQSHCFFPQCDSHDRLAVPKWLRVKLFIDYKFYVPLNCRICTLHLQNDEWQQLRQIENPIRSYASHHIEDFASFVDERSPALDFSNIDKMSEDLVHFWIGLTKSQFRELILNLPRLSNMRKGKLALAAYLVKIRTGDSDERLATLFNMPRTTLMRYMNKARSILKDYVPRNLGTNNISREQIAARNLLMDSFARRRRRRRARSQL